MVKTAKDHRNVPWTSCARFHKRIQCNGLKRSKRETKKVREKCGENGKMERSETKVGPVRGSPAGLNNTRQNAVGHQSPRFLNQREMARVDERKEENRGRMEQPRFLFKCPEVTRSRQMWATRCVSPAVRVTCLQRCRLRGSRFSRIL